MKSLDDYLTMARCCLKQKGTLLMAPKIIVYSGDYCPFCVRAKQLLESKGLEYEEINVDTNPQLKKEIIKKTGMRTIPQIFINDEFIGGFMELAALDYNGELDEKVK